MHIGSSYLMNGQILDEVLMHKDLGIIVTSNLKVAEHCLQAYSKANKMSGLVKRTIKHGYLDMMIHLYKSLVRPHVEYCSLGWSSHYVEDKALSIKFSIISPGFS